MDPQNCLGSTLTLFLAFIIQIASIVQPSSGQTVPVVCPVERPFASHGKRVGPNGYSTELISKNPVCTPLTANLEPANWKRGIRVRGNCNGQIARGTAIAIFEYGETFFNKAQIKSRHAAIFLKCGENKIVAIEQKVIGGQQPVMLHYGGPGLRNGNKYYVVNVQRPATSSGTPKTLDNLGAAQGIPIRRERFTYFWQETDVFSQWYPSTFSGVPLFSENTPFYQQYSFINAEQWMMLCKALLFDDHATAGKILRERTAAGIKALGRGITPFDPVVWGRYVVDVIYAGNFLKFGQNSGLLGLLEKTKGTTLVEASPFDKMYGIGLQSNDPSSRFRSLWDGRNILGETLTRLRRDLTGIP